MGVAVFSVSLCIFSNRLIHSVSGGVGLRLNSSVDFAPMSNLMYHNRLFVVKNFINDAIIAHAELVQSGKVACVGLWSDVVQIGGEPVDTFNDSTSNRLIQSLQFTGSRL